MAKNFQNPQLFFRVPVTDDGGDGRCLIIQAVVEEITPDIHQQPPHYRAPRLEEIQSAAFHICRRPYLLPQHLIQRLPEPLT